MELIPGLFNTYHMTEQDTIQGCFLNPYQLAMLQNDLAEAATEKVRLPYPTSPEQLEEYRGRMMYLQARIDYIQDIIERHKRTEEAIEIARREQAALNQPPVDTNLRNLWNNSSIQQSDKE